MNSPFPHWVKHPLPPVRFSTTEDGSKKLSPTKRAIGDWGGQLDERERLVLRTITGADRFVQQAQPPLEDHYLCRQRRIIWLRLLDDAHFLIEVEDGITKDLVRLITNSRTNAKKNQHVKRTHSKLTAV